MVVDVKCKRCNEKCYGEVVTVSGNYFHQKCFTCKVDTCTTDLIQNGYFKVDDDFYCRRDYHNMKGTKCARCDSYVEGVAIAAINQFFHPTCFTCYHCNNIFNPNIEVCYDGERISCGGCSASNTSQLSKDNVFTNGSMDTNKRFTSEDIDDLNVTDAEVESISYNQNVKCAGCYGLIGDRESLIALEKAWHLRCFTCYKCGKMLSEEYIGKDGMPYCEQDYQTEFGVLCSGCNVYITGKVLQAGGKYYHPSCSRCVKCNELFGEGDEMYLRGLEIWHPKCSKENDLNEVVSDVGMTNCSKNNSLTELQSKSVPVMSPYLRSNTKFESTIKTSAEHIVWKPPCQTSYFIYLGHPFGFQTAIPPRPSTVDENLSEVDSTPHIPPPPNRSSSSSWRMKYSSATEQNLIVKRSGPITDTGTYLNSGDTKCTINAENVVTSLDCINQLNHEPTNDDVSPNLCRKGLGINQLQYRWSLRESQRCTGNK